MYNTNFPMPNYQQSAGFSSGIFTLIAWVVCAASAIQIFYIFYAEVDFLAGTAGFVVKNNSAIGLLSFFIPVALVSFGIATGRFLVFIVAVLSIFAVFSLYGKLFHIESVQGFNTANLPTVSNQVIGSTVNTISDKDMKLSDIKNAPAAAIYARANGYKKGRGLTPAEIEWCQNTQRTDEAFVINCTSKFKWSKS